MKSVRCLFLVALLLTATTAFAATHEINLTAESSHISLVAHDGDALHFRVEVGQLQALDVTTPAGDFSRLLIPGFHSSKTVGEPELPMLNRLIEIPYGARADIEIIATQTREISLAEFGINNPLLPTQPSMPKNVEPANWPFIHHPEAYTVMQVAQPLVNLVEMGRLRAVDIGRIEVSPVTYLPGDDSLVVTESVEFRVNFSGIDYAAEAELKALTDSPFFDVVYAQIAGLRDQHDNHPDRVRDLVTYVILTPPEFEAQMQPFVEWKTERGFKVVVGVTGTPEVGTTTSSIQSYIHGLYNDATPELPAPSFVLFVGDVAQMPTWSMSGDPTDRPYCDVTGDTVPDIYYGRFSATNASQLQAILDKTLMYDTYSMPDPSYLHEVVMIAGMDSSFGSVWANGQINYGTTYYFNAAHNIYSHTYLYPNSGSQSSAIVQNVSDGVSYINYTAHGSTTSWADPSFTQANINGLQNYGEYCLAVGNCCQTSTYDYGECFAETWLRAAGKGAIGYIGGSNNTYWDEDYWWGVGSGSIVVNPTYETHGLGAYDGVFHDHGEPMTKWYVTNDAIIFTGNLAVMEGGSSLVTYYWNIYNLMGDPSISTWIGTPQVHNVDHDDALLTSATSLAVDAVPNSYCGLTLDGVLIGAGTVDESGSLDLEIWEPLVPGTAQLIVMAQFMVPYTADIPILPPTGPYLVFDSVTVLDDSGDLDGELDEGEEAGLEITLSNVGINAAVGVSATLTTTDPFVTILTSTSAYPDIPADGFGTSDSPYQVVVDANAPDGHVVDFALHVTAGSDAWDTEFDLAIQAPVVTVHTVGLNDDTGGDGSGTADAGETFDLAMLLINSGQSGAGQITGTLGCADPHVTILDATAICPGVPEAGSGTLEAFTVEIDILCPEPATIAFQLALVASNGYATDLEFTLDVGGWFDDMENDRGWTVGAAGDDASSGIWERVDPIGTTYNSVVVQCEDDHTPAPGTHCYVTQNGSVGGTAGEADVDGGKTTLISPVFYLADAVSAEISYWRWYTNNAGNNPNEDYWDVDVTADGNTWISLEHTNMSAATWTHKVFELTDYITLTNHVQIRFVASDEINGSLVEAGVDDFLLTREYTVTAVGDDDAVPERLALGRNYPNPFNPKTTIAFDLPRTAQVELTVFDVTGRRVSTLVADQLPAGRHDVTWTGLDDAGRRVASGMYFYRLVMENEVLTQKMVLLK